MSKLRSPRPLVHVGLPAPSKTRNPAPICSSQCAFTSELSTSSQEGKYFLFASPGTDCQIRMTCWAEFRLLQLLYFCFEKQINYQNVKCNGNKRLKIDAMQCGIYVFSPFPQSWVTLLPRVSLVGSRSMSMVSGVETHWGVEWPFYAKSR